ncbi:MAG TPA: hypothetical protein VFK60_10190 [Casimicrobiaceae bacterium]|nr:hypothetical protein [Casimicrobiaceae bacterium]
MPARRAVADAVAPHAPLELSGPKLRIALEALVVRSEEYGGVERYVEALKLKTELFANALGGGRAGSVDAKTLRQLLSLIATVRRRIGPWLDGEGSAPLVERFARLLDGAADTANVDRALAEFCSTWPDDRAHRWVRDLGAEILHNTDPERFPLMCRWVWDRRSNTGVLRELWHAEDIDRITLQVPDDHQTFVALREELSQYLTANGVYRDVLQYVDLLTAQVYAEYISEQAGSYLRTDFQGPEDPMLHTRRMLGLDVARAGRSRLKAFDGRAVVADAPRLPG